MKLIYRLHFAAMISFFIVCSAAHAAAPYQFERVALAPEGTFVTSIALNNVGQVAYNAFTANGSQSLFRWTAGQTETVVREGDLCNGQKISVPWNPAINDSGTIAFATRQYSGHQTGLNGVFRLDPGGLTKIGPLQSQTTFFTNWVGIGNNGVVSHITQISGSEIDLFRGNGQTTQTVFAGGLYDPIGSASVNQAGDYIFRAFSGLASAPDEIVLVQNGVTTVIAAMHSQATPRFDSLSQGNINNNGDVIFIGHVQGESGGNSLFKYESGQLTRILDVSQTGFSSLAGNIDLNDAGHVLFKAGLDGGGSGLFTGFDPVADCLIRTGDILDGRVVTSIGGSTTLNNVGQTAFRVEFSDGQEGIYLATPVPEPCSFFVILLSIIVVAKLRLSNSNICFTNSK